MAHATGSFDVETSPDGPQERVDGFAFGRWSLDKRFRGGLDATSTVRMLSAGVEATGLGAYVAIEHATGTLDGRAGTFVLIHTGTRTGVSQELSVTVVPGLSTGDLIGLGGEMSIKVVDGEHFYDFEYTIGA